MAEQHPIPTHSRFKDLTGKRFNRWTVVYYAGMNASHFATWLCRCDCGTERVVIATTLYGNTSRSCGCLQREIAGTLTATHRASTTAEYKVWTGMKSRCYNPARKSYADYGGRGIRICDRWLHSFESFLADMGKRPTRQHTIERNDHDGNYEPSNCCWVLRKVQNSNTRSTRTVEYCGAHRSVLDLASEFGVSAMAIYKRTSRGQSAEHAISALLATKRQASPAS